MKRSRPSAHALRSAGVTPPGHEQRTVQIVNAAELGSGYGPRSPHLLQATYQGTPFTGFVQTFWDDGTLRQKSQRIGGYADGVCYEYSPEGTLQSAWGRLFDMEHGRQRYYDEHGKLEKEELTFLHETVVRIVHPRRGKPYITHDTRTKPALMAQLDRRIRDLARSLLPSIELPLEEAYAWFPTAESFDVVISPEEFAAARKAGHLFVSPDLREGLGFLAKESTQV